MTREAAPRASDPAARLVLDAIAHQYGKTEAVRGVSLSVAPGEVICLLGPSGCGKSTSLRIAAGVERQSAGRVFIDGRLVASDAVFVPPEHRHVGLMFQDYALFPHLTVAQNVAFGLNRLDRRERERRVGEALERVQMERFAPVYPAQLSGGEQQRVALARALAPRPGVMLMDEPFSGLDVPKRDRIRDETWALLKETGTATVLVTHDPKEAMRMADRIALMRSGRVVQLDGPAAIYHRPVDRAAAAFFSDLNVFQGVVAQGRVATPLGPAPAPGLAEGVAVEVVLRPHALRVSADPSQGVPGRVRRAVLLGPETLLELVLETAPDALEPVRAVAPGLVPPLPGARLSIAVSPGDMLVFAQKGEADPARLGDRTIAPTRAV